RAGRPRLQPGHGGGRRPEGGQRERRRPHRPQAGERRQVRLRRQVRPGRGGRARRGRGGGGAVGAARRRGGGGFQQGGGRGQQRRVTGRLLERERVRRQLQRLGEEAVLLGGRGIGPRLRGDPPLVGIPPDLVVEGDHLRQGPPAQ